MAQTKSKVSGKQVLQELKSPALIVVGMIGGNLAGKAIDKVLKVDETQVGFDVKAVAKPVVQLTAGIAGAVLLKDENLKLVATGVAASGVASGVKIMLKKDLLAGFSGLGNGQALSQVRGLLRAESYNPDLPELSAGEFETYSVEYPEANEDYNQYEEIQEVEIL
jgi:hypothetical protein